jgi:thiol-disulfide isomerase/thioredoxin
MPSRDEHEPPDGGAPRRADRNRGSRGLVASAVALLVAIAALTVLALATRGDTPVDRESNGAAPAAGRNTGERGGTVAQIRASRREGNALIDTSLDALRGVPVVVNQWASWCPPCRAEFPFVAAMAERYRSEVAFLGLNSRDQRGAAEAFLKEHPVSYPSVFDENAEQARSIGAGTGWPTTVFFDADGNAVLIRQGGYTDAATLEADIREHALGLPRAGPG